MTDPVSALGRFTPTAPNRDDLLFAAGRASARPSRWWKAAAGFLAGSQAVTLAVLLGPKPTPAPAPAPPPAVAPPPVPPPEPPPSDPDPHSYLALTYRDADPEPRERVAPGPVRPERPLTAGSRQFD